MLTFSDSSGREVHELKIHFLHRNLVPRLQYCTRRHWQFPQNTSSENSPRGNRGWPGFGCLFCCPSSWSLMSTHDKRRALLSCSFRACTPGLGAHTKHWAPSTGPQGIREHSDVHPASSEQPQTQSPAETEQVHCLHTQHCSYRCICCKYKRILMYGSGCFHLRFHWNSTHKSSRKAHSSPNYYLCLIHMGNGTGS